MNLAKAFLPEAVEVLGKYYKIHTGHSFWFRFSQLLNEDKLFLHDVDFLYDGEIPEDRQAGFDALCKFFYEKKEIPRGEGGENILDYDIDAELLYAGILQCYGIDLFDEQYHWHKVSDDCRATWNEAKRSVWDPQLERYKKQRGNEVEKRMGIARKRKQRGYRLL